MNRPEQPFSSVEKVSSARLAEAATNQPLHLRYKRMEAAWLALANEQDWLDGEMPPIDTTKQPPT
jgi:hypothetical protein